MTDFHTLYVKTNQDSLKEIKKKISSCLIGDKRFIVNRVDGFSFVYFLSSEVFNMILGRNPDGSERKQIKVCDVETESNLWSDMCEVEEVVLEPLILFPYECTPAFVPNISNKYLSNILIAENCPNWIRKTDLESLIFVFNVPVDISIFSQNGKKNIMLEFCSNEAQFILHMIRKLPVQKKYNGKTLEDILFFKHPVISWRKNMK